MKQFKISGMILAASIMMLAGTGYAETKIAIVDVGKVLEGYPAAKTAEKKLGAMRMEFEAEARGMVAELKQMKDSYSEARDAARNNALADKVRRENVAKAEKLLTAFKEREYQLREIQMKTQKELEADLLEARKEVIEKLKNDIADYCRKNGYDLVLDSSGKNLRTTEQVIYASAKLDITEELLALFKNAAEQ